jgi:hypothetical protein
MCFLFTIATSIWGGGCKVLVHGIQVVSDVHFDEVVLQMHVMNIFNTILFKAMF